MPAYDGTSTDKFWIGFTPENSIDDDIGLTKEELSKIPFVGYWTCIDFWNEENARDWSAVFFPCILKCMSITMQVI